VSDSNSEWVLYHNNFSLCSRKVRICLEEYKIDYLPVHIHIIETKDCENLSKDFLKINPKATVPVLLHNNQPIYESHEQIRYLMETFPNKLGESETVDYWNKKGSLVGDDPVNGIKEYAGNCVSLLTQPLFVSMLRKISFLKFFNYFIKHPSKFRALNFTLYRLLGYSVFNKNSPHQRVAIKAFENLKSHLTSLDVHLENKIWIDGDKFSIADITWMTLLHRLDEVNLIGLFTKKLSNLRDYYSRLKNRKSFSSCIIEFSSEAIDSGTKNLREDIQKVSNLKHLYNNFETNSLS
jgi:glutathione S-transferase